MHWAKRRSRASGFNSEAVLTCDRLGRMPLPRYATLKVQMYHWERADRTRLRSIRNTKHESLIAKLKKKFLGKINSCQDFYWLWLLCAILKIYTLFGSKVAPGFTSIKIRCAGWYPGMGWCRCHERERGCIYFFRAVGVIARAQNAQLIVNKKAASTIKLQTASYRPGRLPGLPGGGGAGLRCMAPTAPSASSAGP